MKRIKRRGRKNFIRQLACFALFVCGAISCTSYPAEKLVQGSVWRDTDGRIINAHGGCILYYDSVYYWYGEYKGDSTYRLTRVKTWECWRADAGGISCYSSKDLLYWKFEGIVLPAVTDDTSSDLHPSRVIERPKVIYNEETNMFVMWMHIENPDYEKAHAGVAVSDMPDAVFTYLGSFRPNGSDSRDQTLFKDDDGRAYQIASSEWNKTLTIGLLNSDYTQMSGIYTRAFINLSREAPAVFKYGQKYYMITSACTGWDPNMAQYAVADSMLGEWTLMGNPCKGRDSELTFYSQSTFVFRMAGKSDQFIAMFDKWNKTDLDDSRYIWLPVTFTGNAIEIAWKNFWTP
jgi:beta-galactosidase